MRRMRHRAACILITALLALICFLTGSLKKGYHPDELSTFSLSNKQYDPESGLEPTILDGAHTSGDEIWDSSFTVKGNKRFDYANVFINQAHDVHPPLYYILIHTVSSLFPDLSIIILGLLINVPLACLTFWQFFKITQLLEVRSVTGIALCAAYVLGMAYVNNAVVFLRMYALLGVWINFLIIIFLKHPASEKGRLRYYISLGAVILGGALTHYYFLVYAFLICAVYAVLTALKKNWSKLFLSFIPAAAAAVAAYFIFPAAVYHLLESYRGKEAIENAAGADLWKNLRTDIFNINKAAFGGLFAVIMIVCICLLIMARLRRGSALLGIRLERYIILLVPACAYMIVIAKIAPFRQMRYYIGVIGPLFIAIFSLMAVIARQMFRSGDLFIALLSAIILCVSYRDGLSWLRTDAARPLQILSEHEDAACLYIYDRKWKIAPNFPELRGFKDVVFVSWENWDEYKATDYNTDSLIAYMAKKMPLKAGQAIADIKAGNDLTADEKLFSSWYADVYYLS